MGEPAAKASAVDVGNAHHVFLERVAITQTETVTQLKSEARRLEEQGVLSAEEAMLLDFDGLSAFWSSDLGSRIRAQAQFVGRELAFTARFSPEELARVTGEPASPSLAREFVVVQGVADLAVILPQKIWLVDFKTDEVAPKELLDKVKLYEPQLRLYAGALERIYQRRVAEGWLYFLAAREGHLCRACSE